MITGELKNKIDTLWNAFWMGGISNPIEVIEQLPRPRPRQGRGRLHLGLGQPALRRQPRLRDDGEGSPRRRQTKKTELLFLALFLRILKPGGRAAVIVPDGVLFGSSKAHKDLRRILVEDHKLDGVVSLPSGVFKPYAGVSTAILLFTKTNSGGTDRVWFYDMQADGYSLDDKRTPLLGEDRLGVRPAAKLSAEEAKNNLPDVLARWQKRDGAEKKRPKTAQSFTVDKSAIAAQGYDLSINRYKEVVHEEQAQQAFARRVEAVERVKASQRAHLAELDALFQSLQHRAFRGEL
jgi:type I restriction enzyme M protein